MDKETYTMLHASADRLALEAVRKITDGTGAADCYLRTYEKVLDFLIVEHGKHNLRIPGPNTD